MEIVGFHMGMVQVGPSDTTPVPVIPIPLMGMGTTHDLGG